MNDTKREKPSPKSERQQPDESHIIRSDNSINPNRELYGGNTGDAQRAENDRKKSEKSDPSSFPGGPGVKK